MEKEIPNKFNRGKYFYRVTRSENSNNNGNLKYTHVKLY